MPEEHNIIINLFSCKSPQQTIISLISDMSKYYFQKSLECDVHTNIEWTCVNVLFITLIREKAGW